MPTPRLQTLSTVGCVEFHSSPPVSNLHLCCAVEYMAAFIPSPKSTLTMMKPPFVDMMMTNFNDADDPDNAGTDGDNW